MGWKVGYEVEIALLFESTYASADDVYAPLT